MAKKLSDRLYELHGDDMEGMMSSGKKKVDTHRKKNPDTRTQAQKEKDAAGRAESRKWKEQRDEAQRQQLEEFLKNRGTSKPRGGN